MPEPTIRPTRADQRLANAVLHLANALDNPRGIAGVGPSCDAARDLVRDLAAPDHAEKRSIVFSRQARRRPDGVWETRDGQEGP